MLVPSEVVGVVVPGPDIEGLAQGTVESLTEWDWSDVPADMQDALRLWWTEFYRRTHESPAASHED